MGNPQNTHHCRTEWWTNFQHKTQENQNSLSTKTPMKNKEPGTADCYRGRMLTLTNE